VNGGAAMRPLPDLHLATEHVESLVIRLKDAGFQLLTYELDCSSMGTVTHPGRMVSAELLADTGMLVSLSGSDVGVVAGHLLVAAGPVRDALGARQDETTLAAALRVAGELAVALGERNDARARHVSMHREIESARHEVRQLRSVLRHHEIDVDKLLELIEDANEHLTIDDEGAEGEGPVCRDMGGEG
jgi:hypothetical protein